MISYRKLHIEEVEKFWQLMNKLDYDTKYMLYEPGEREAKASDTSRLEGLIESAGTNKDFLLVAEVNEQLVGYITAERGALNRIKHTAYIVVGILKEYTNQGIGTTFFKELDVWALEHNISRLELTVICENAIAKYLYEKSGFVIEGIKHQSVNIEGRLLDEFYMAKIIG